jgi:hypothetical protein
MPTNEPVEQRILDNVRTTLAAIVAGTDYYTSVRRVHDMENHPLQVNEFPAVLVSYVGCEKDLGECNGHVKCDLRLDVYVVNRKSTATWRRDIERFAADVDKALTSTWTRGELDSQANAFDTLIERTVVADESDGFPVALARLEARIVFRHVFGDPTAAA